MTHKFIQTTDGDHVTYICLMHPEVVRAEPGSCPKCGMALEPRASGGEAGEDEDITRRLVFAVR